MANSSTLATLRAGALAGAALLGLGSCAYAPVAVEGVGPPIDREASENPWVFVPVNAWITRETIAPRALGMCSVEACPGRVAVAVVEARGREARDLLASVRAPSSLARRLELGNADRRRRMAEANRGVGADIAARRMPKTIAAEANTLNYKAFRGFSLVIRRTEGEARVAHAAVLTRQDGQRLRAVVVVAETATAAADAARGAADARL